MTIARYKRVTRVNDAHEAPQSLRLKTNVFSHRNPLCIGRWDVQKGEGAMKLTRRDFLRLAGAAGAAALTSGSAA